MWPTPGSTISFAFGTTAANGFEWMFGDTVLSESPVITTVGALIAAAEAGSEQAKWLGLAAVVMASVNIFGGFAVTERMLAMYKKKERH